MVKTTQALQCKHTHMFSLSRLESGRSRVRISLATGFFPGRVIPVTSKLVLQWLPCQAPGDIGSVLGLVGPVSVYCEWVR